MEPGPGHRVARRINSSVRNLVAHGIATKIHYIPGHSAIPGNKEVDRHANLAPDRHGSTITERTYSSTSNRARPTSEDRSAAKPKWEANKCSKHFSYRLTGMAETKGEVTGL